MSIIDPDNGAGTDFLSLNAWNAAALPASDIAYCRSSGGNPDIGGSTTVDNANAIGIERHEDDGQFMGWRDSDYTFQGVLTIGKNDFTIKGVQVEQNTGTFAANSLYIDQYRGNYSNVYADGVKTRRTGTGNRQNGFFISRGDSGIVYVANHFSLDFQGSSAVGFFGNAGNVTLEFHSVLAYNCVTGYGNNSSPTNLRSSVALDCGTDFAVTYPIHDTCASLSLVGDNPVAPLGNDWDNEYPTRTTRDFNLATSGNLENAGLATGAWFTTDAVGTVRSVPWDLGPAEIAAVGPITYEISADLDAILFDSYERQTTLDSLLLGVYEKQSNLDSILKKTIEIQATLDAFIAGRGFQTVSLDSVLQLISSLQTNLDSILTLSSELETTLDALLLEGGTRVSLLDSILQTINNERSVTLDALVQIHDEIETTLDAIVYARRTRSTDLDAILTDFLTVNTILDSLLLEVGRTHRVWLTAYLFQSSAITTDLDAIITSALNERFTTLDANLLDLDRLLATTLDAILGEGLKFPHECFVSEVRESFKAAAREEFVALPDTCKDRRRAI